MRDTCGGLTVWTDLGLVRVPNAYGVNMRTPRPCLDCGGLFIPGTGTVTTGGATNSRCAPCMIPRRQARENNRNRPSPKQRGYDGEYRKARAQLLANHPTCVYCGAPATTADHVVPVSKGGTTKDNLVPACARCNSQRGNRT